MITISDFIEKDLGIKDLALYSFLSDLIGNEGITSLTLKELYERTKELQFTSIKSIQYNYLPKLSKHGFISYIIEDGIIYIRTDGKKYTLRKE